MTQPIRSLLTKLLHGALLCSVLFQLIGSTWIEIPETTQPGNFFCELHQIVGLVTLALVTAFWVWMIARRRETPIAALFPWASRTRLVALRGDMLRHCHCIRRLQIPPARDDGPVASAVHGLGLLAALAMASTGAWLFTQDVPSGWVLEVHKLVSNLMWAYVVGHAGLAVLHQLAGHQVLQRMFRAKPRNE